MNGQLTHIELHAIENGRVDMHIDEHGHPRGKSVFKVRRSPVAADKDIIFLEPKS